MVIRSRNISRPHLVLRGRMGLLRRGRPRSRTLAGPETVVPNLRVLTANTELGGVQGVTLRKPRDILRAAGTDHCVMDLGMGVSSPYLDTMLEADAMVLVTTPEPAAVDAVYRVLRHAFTRALTQRFRAYPLEPRRRAQGGSRVEGRRRRCDLRKTSPMCPPWRPARRGSACSGCARASS